MNMDVLKECGHVMGSVSDSIRKHGNWDGYSIAQMLQVIHDEFREVCTAAELMDVSGPHGMVAELRQVAACCIKMSLRLEREL